MKIFKKIAGIALLVLTLALILLEALAVYVKIDEWVKYGEFPTGLDALLILSAIILAIAAVCGFIGKKLAFDKKDKQELSFAQQEAANEKPVSAQPSQSKNNPVSSSRSRVVFSSGIGYLFYSTIKATLIGFLIIILLGFVIFDYIYLPKMVEMSIKIIFALAFGIAWALLFCNINITVDENGLHFHRNGKNYLDIALFDIESVKSNTVIYSFVPIVSRVITYNSGSKSKRVTCHCFEKKEFDNMIEYINLLRRETSAAVSEQAQAQQ